MKEISIAPLILSIKKTIAGEYSQINLKFSFKEKTQSKFQN
jgi:hypothetical protein